MYACRLRDSPSTSSTHNNKKSNRHLEQRRNRKSDLGNLYIGGVRAGFLRRDTLAVETTRAAAIKGQGHRNPTGLKTAFQLLSSPCPNLAGVSFTHPRNSNALCPPCHLPLLLLVARDLQGLLAGCSSSLRPPRHSLVQAEFVCLKSKSGMRFLAKSLHLSLLLDLSRRSCGKWRDCQDRSSEWRLKVKSNSLNLQKTAPKLSIVIDLDGT